MSIPKITIIIVSVILVLAAVYFWHTPIKIEEAIWQPNVTINEHNFIVEVLYSDEEKRQGLANEDFLLEDNGILFLFDIKKVRTFWMKDMKFNIDLLWIDDQEIVGIEKLMLAPESDILYKDLIKYDSPKLINKVLEFPAGTVDKYSIQVGDTINFDIYDRNKMEGN